ncbi:LIM/homeobox protein Awh [Acropora cervicornis]|uniref:LIM/homeobox protein Awh n=1 Tax=Acropora cervicornis TaxID=6130 RepID=A0AAD9QSV1_ACRCE|nr:LIM/homeobox protein Awh [Acropora cervicornis]
MVGRYREQAVMLMTTACEEKSAANFTREVGDQTAAHGENCAGCKGRIMDRYLVKVSGKAWHTSCLKCCMCGLELGKEATCYTKEDRIYCKTDYARQFGTKCARCGRSIHANDWVRRARSSVYHLACFACDACKRQLSTGEEFALKEGHVLFGFSFCTQNDGGIEDMIQDADSEDSPSSGGILKCHKTKRVRTTFTEEQLQILQANFNVDSNPDGQDLERIAQLTGLSKRVTQVWFQNSRARQKKYGTPLFTASPRTPSSTGL